MRQAQDRVTTLEQSLATAEQAKEGLENGAISLQDDLTACRQELADAQTELTRLHASSINAFPRFSCASSAAIVPCLLHCNLGSVICRCELQPKHFICSK